MSLPFSRRFFSVVFKASLALFLCVLLIFTVLQKSQAWIIDQDPPRITITLECQEGDIPYTVWGGYFSINTGFVTCSSDPDTGLLPISIACDDISSCYTLYADIDTTNTYDGVATPPPVYSANLTYETNGQMVITSSTGTPSPEVFNGKLVFHVAQGQHNTPYYVISTSANDYAGNISKTDVKKIPWEGRFTVEGQAIIDPNGNCSGTVAYTGAGTNFSKTAGPGTLIQPGTDKPAGTYEVLSIPYNSTVTMDMPVVPNGYSRPPCDNQPATISNITSGPRVKNFFITETSKLDGYVILDYNHNAAEDINVDKGKAGATVTLSGCGQNPPPTTTGVDGKYEFTNLPLCPAGYSIQVTDVGAGYTMNYTSNLGNPNPRNIVIAGGGAPNRVENFYVTPLYTISGNIFVDNDISRLKEVPGESNYTGSTSTFRIAPSANPGGSSTQDIPTGNGSYTGTVISGYYSVEHLPPLPLGYYRTYPQNNPAAFLVAVGNTAAPAPYQCTVGTHNAATCSPSVEPGTALTGSIINLNFGISNSLPWTQCLGGDCRNDNGYKSPVPTDAATCVGAGNDFAAIPSSSNTPGVIFSGNNDFSFCVGGVGSCQAKASSPAWVVKGDVTTPETFTPRYSGAAASSFQALYDKIVTKGGITPTPLGNVCTLSDCNLNGIPKGVYTTTSDVNINAFNIPANRNIIILVGDINNLNTYKTVAIRGEIKVLNNSTFTLSVRGDISVAANVGESTVTSSTTNLEGFYSADRDFIVQTAGTVTCDAANPDRRLNFAGAVVANAGYMNGTFRNLRNLCANNRCPAVTFKERPDFFLNAPQALQYKSLLWKEVAP